MKPNRIVVAWLVKYVSDDGTKYYATSADPRRGLGPRKRAHRFASREEAVKWRDARCALPPVLAASAYRVSAVTRPAPVEASKPADVPEPRVGMRFLWRSSPERTIVSIDNGTIYVRSSLGCWLPWSDVHHWRAEFEAGRIRILPDAPAPRTVALDEVLWVIDERIANSRLAEAALIDGRLRIAFDARAAANALELARAEIVKLGGAS